MNSSRTGSQAVHIPNLPRELVRDDAIGADEGIGQSANQQTSFTAPPATIHAMVLISWSTKMACALVDAHVVLPWSTWAKMHSVRTWCEAAWSF
jgi:hypothetical protein